MNYLNDLIDKSCTRTVNPDPRAGPQFGKRVAGETSRR